MATSRERSVLIALKTLIATVNGSGSYAYDLSADGAVTIGRPRGEDTRLPRCWLAPAVVVTQSGTTMPRMRSTMDVDVEARVSPAAQTPEGRVLAAMVLCAEIRAALEGDRDLGGLAREVIVSSVAEDGDEVGMGLVGIVYMTVSITWERNGGGIT